MKKTLLFIFLLLICSVSMSEKVQSTIFVSSKSSKEITPDSAKIKFSIKQSGKSFNENKTDIQKNYNLFINELKKIGIVIDNITIEDNAYNLSEKDTDESATYTTTLRIKVSNADNFILQLMSIEGVRNVTATNNKNEYILTITSSDKNKKQSIVNVFNRSKYVESILLQNNINKNDIKLESYSIVKAVEKNTENVEKEYNTTNYYSFTTRSINRLPEMLKIIEKYNVSIDPMIEFIITDYDKINKEMYDEAFNKAQTKARTILSNVNSEVIDVLNIKDQLKYDDIYTFKYETPDLRTANIQMTMMSDKSDNGANIDFIPKKINVDRELFITFGTDSKNENNNRFLEINESEVKSINVNQAKINFTIHSKNEKNEKAISENNALYNKFISILEGLNISYENVESVDLSTSKSEENDNEMDTFYSTNMTVNISSNVSLNEIEQLINILNEKDIDNVSTNENGQYIFSITSEEFKNRESAHNNVLSKYNEIVNLLSSKGFDTNKISINGFENIENERYVDSNKIKTMYEIRREYTITTKDLKNVYNLIASAKLLNFEVSPYINLKIDNIDEVQNNIYKELFGKINKKNEQIASSSNVDLLTFKTIIDKSSSYDSTVFYINDKYLNNLSSDLDTNGLISKPTSSYVREIKNNLLEFIAPTIDVNVDVEIKYGID